MQVTCPVCGEDDIDTKEEMRRTSGPKKKPTDRRSTKLVSYGYCLYVHTCKMCKHTWDGDRFQLGAGKISNP